jgi:hypothetical protein
MTNVPMKVFFDMMSRQRAQEDIESGLNAYRELNWDADDIEFYLQEALNEAGIIGKVTIDGFEDVKE